MASFPTEAYGQSERDVPRLVHRLRCFDALRGFSVCSMVAFHLCYDLAFLAGVSLSWFVPPLRDIWRATISWTFLFIAGCMCSYSRNNLKRAVRYLVTAAAIYVVTSNVAIDTPISFGIIYCMGASTLATYVLGCIGRRPYGHISAVVLIATFLLLRGLPQGYVGIAPFRAYLPRELYATPWLSWLGLPGPGFLSGDYYPLLPYVLMYLAGTAMGSWWRDNGLPPWLSRLRSAPFELIGRHALLIYIAHQPILLLISMSIAA